MTTPPTNQSQIFNEIESGLIEMFIESARVLGLPKSVGQIYGLLYVSQSPLSMEDVMLRLGISQGSASQGLKQLRAFRAIRLVYVQGQRRDYYEPEIELRKLVSGFVREVIYPHLEQLNDRLGHLEELVNEDPDLSHNEHLLARLESMKTWNGKGLQVVKGAQFLTNLYR